MTSTPPKNRLAILFICGLLIGMTWSGVLAQPDAAYWRLDDILARFDAWEAAYPDIFHREVIGVSGEGEDIVACRISDNASTQEAEPRLLIHAAQHANECNGTGAVMESIRELLEGYGANPGITARVDGLEIWFLPIVNVDGHRLVFSTDEPWWDDWRKTLRDNNENGEIDYPYDGVDLNRNWDWKWDNCDEDYPGSNKYKGPFPFSEAEAVALRDFVLFERPVVVVDYHSPVTISWTDYIFWPWMSSYGAPDQGVASDIAQDWAWNTLTLDGGHFHSIMCYDTLPKEQCWIYGRTGILTYLMEISDRCWWTGADVDSIAHRVSRGANYLLDRVLDGPGISGRITDALTGQPLVAELVIQEMHSDNVGPRLSEASFGQYQRLTRSGTFHLSVSREGYLDDTRTVSVGSTGWSSADFSLQPDPTSVAAAWTIDTSWLRSRNPLRGGEYLRLTLPDGVGPVGAELLDVRGRRVADLGDRLRGGASHELNLPCSLSSGVYLLRLRGRDRERVERITLLR